MLASSIPNPQPGSSPPDHNPGNLNQTTTRVIPTRPQPGSSPPDHNLGHLHQITTRVISTRPQPGSSPPGHNLGHLHQITTWVIPTPDPHLRPQPGQSPPQATTRVIYTNQNTAQTHRGHPAETIYYIRWTSVVAMT